MSRFGKPAPSTLLRYLRFLIAAVFLIGFLPAPALAEGTPPANITDLTAGSPTHNSVALNWTAPADDGLAVQYEIRYANSAINDEDAWNSAVTAAGTPPPPQTAGTPESFIVTGLGADTTYFFAVKTRDDTDLLSGLSNSPSATTLLPPTFTITHSQDRYSFMLAAGANITETFNVTSINNFSGTINLNFGGPPEIANNSSVTPSQVTLAAGQIQAVTLRIGASAMAPSGAYQCGLNGNAPGQQKGAFFTVIIGVPGQPLLSASPPVVGPGGQSNIFAAQFPGASDITLMWGSGPNAGQTITSGQTAGDGTWNTTLNIPAEASGGVFTLRAIAGEAFATCQITITSGSGPDYLISASPQFVSVTPGQSANITIYVQSVNGFNGTVTLNAGTVPGVTRTLSTSSLTPASGDTLSAVLTITVADWASPSMYQLNIEGACASPQINKFTNINLDIQPQADWGPGISLSQSYGRAGDTITVSGANFPPATAGQTVTIKEVFSNTTFTTSPAVITVNNGSFTGTFTIPSGIPSGNYRIRAIVPSTGDFAERDFQILGTSETFSLSVSPPLISVTTEQGHDTTIVSVNIFSVGGSPAAVNLALEGVPNWLTYRFGALANNTPATDASAISVPAGGSTSVNLQLTASLTAPTGSYPVTVKGWITSGPEQRVSLQFMVQPPAGFGMAEFTLSPTFGESNRTVTFSGSGFTGCTPNQVTELRFGGIDIISAQSLPTITVPASGDSAGRFSGTFRVPASLSPGTYPVEIRVGNAPGDKFINKSFTITGAGDTFVLQASPSFLWVGQGGNIITMIQVQATGSTSPTVTLSLEGYPGNDITASLTQSSVTAPPGGVAGTELSLTAQPWLPAGHYTITVKGVSGAEVHRIPLEMEVAPPAGTGMASIYLSPTSGHAGTWVTVSGSGFPGDTTITHLYLGPPTAENDWVTRLPAIVTDEPGAFTAVLQIPSSLPSGMYMIEAVTGNPPDDRRASAQFTVFGSGQSFSLNVSPMMLQAPPGATVTTSVNVQSVGATSANITLSVEGPPIIDWRFDGGEWGVTKIVTPPIGGAMVSSLEIKPKASAAMGHYSLAVKATAGGQTEIRNLELDIGAAAGYDMPIFSLNPNSGMAGTNVSFSGSNFPPEANVTGLTFGGANITLGQTITTSTQRTFSGSFTVPGTIGGQAIAPGTYNVRVYVGQAQAEAQFYVYGADDTFMISLSPNYLQGQPGIQVRTSGLLKALAGAAPTVKMTVKGLPPGVETAWNEIVQSVFTLTTPPGGQNNFQLGLVLPNMIAMGQYPAVLEGWVDTNANNVWDSGEKISRVNLELSIMPPQGYNMGMLSLNPSYGRAGDRITFSGSGFPRNTGVTSLTFAGTNVLTAAITTSDDDSGSFSGVFTVPALGPGNYPVEAVVGDRRGGFEFQIVSGDQKFSVSTSPGWLARPAGDTASVSIQVRSLVATPPSPSVVVLVEGLPMGVTPSFTTTTVTPPVGAMESRELRLTISSGCPMGNYPISVRAYNTANTSEEIWANFTLEVTPSAGFMDMGMTMITVSPTFGAAGDRITVSGYGFPKSQSLTSIRLGPQVVTPGVATTTDATGAFSAVITVPSLPSGTHPLEVNVQNTIRNIPFNVMGAGDTFSIEVSPNWLQPIPAGDPNGRQIAITVNALPGKTTSVTLSTEGLFVSYGTIAEVWNPTSKSVNITGTGGAATATLTLIASENLPPGPYPFNIVAIDGSHNRRDFHMEFQVGPPAGFMGMTDQGVFFPEIFLSPNSGPVGTQVTFTGTNLPAGASITAINFAGNAVPLPGGGLTADETGSLSGSFVVSESWNLAAGGMYWVDFRLQKDDWWQNIGKDFNLMRANAVFSLEATPNWIPPIQTGGNGQTKINVKGLTYNSANVSLAVMENLNGWGMPGGAQIHWNTADGPATTIASVPGGGQTSRNFYLTASNPGHYMITIVGWIDSNANQLLEKNIPSEAESEFAVPLNFDVAPPEGFQDWNADTMMDQMNMSSNDRYLFYFPEIALNPAMGQADTKVNINATDFPAGAVVTGLRFAGTNLPIPTGTAADSNGDFSLVFNVPKTMWGSNIAAGWYDIEVVAQKTGEPEVRIIKQFQVIDANVAFTIWAEPNWLPPIPPGGNGSTLIRVKSMGNAANVTLSMDKIPPGVTAAFSDTQVNLSPGGSVSTTLTLSPTNIPPGHYGAEIKGTATINSVVKTFYTHIEFEVQPSTMFKDTAWMEQQGIWFPEITLNPTAGPVKTKVTIKATDFPAGANITNLRFAGRELPIPAGTAADSNGSADLIFNVPDGYGVGQYMVEVVAVSGTQPIFIAKPFFIEDANVTFKLNVVPGFIPGVEQGSSGSTTVFIESTGPALTVQLYVDGLPPGVTGQFESSSVSIPPGGSSSTGLTITTRASTGPGMYPLTIRGVSGAETRMVPFSFGVMPPASFQMPKFTLDPDYAPAGYDNKQYKIAFSGTGFPANQSVSSLTFGAQPIAIPATLATDANGNFNGVFQMPVGLTPGTYDVRVAVADGHGGFIYDARPFSIRSSQSKFILKASPPYLPPIVQGGQGTTAVTVQSVGTVAANVTLSVDGLAPGITAVFTPGSMVSVTPGTSSSATLTLNVSVSTPPGPYPLSIRGISGSESIVIPLGFSVMPNTGSGGGYASITINPPQARPGEHIGISGAGFTANATITLTAAPPGATAPINITPGTIQVLSDGTWATEITVPPEAQVPPGSYIIKASDGTLAAKCPFNIVPATSADFFLTVSPQFIQVVQGQNGNTAIKLTSKNGFNQSVQFSTGFLAPGVTATFRDAAGNTISQYQGAPGGVRQIVAPVSLTPAPGEDLVVIVNIAVDAATPLGPYDMPLEVKTSTIARAVPLGLMVVSTGANLNLSPASGPADTYISLSGSGFTAGETITVKFAGNSIATVPGTVTAAQDGTFTAVITAPALAAGIYPVRVTGVTSGRVIDRPFSLKPSAVDSFVLYTSPMKVDIPKGGSGTVTLKIEPLGSFQSAVALSVTGLNAVSGATSGISPAATVTPNIATPTTATLTINIPTGAATGRYPLTVTGTSGAITQTRSITLNVVPPSNTPDFAISLAPNTIPINPGASGNTTVTVTAINGFSGAVSLALAMADASATWPSTISYTAGSVTPSANTGLGKQTVVFTASAGAQPGTWTFRITGTSGALTHSTDVMVICTPSGTTVTTYASPLLDPSTVTSSTPMDMTTPWGDVISIDGIINDGGEAGIITPANIDVDPNTLATLPEGATDMLGRVTNVESSVPVDGVDWDIGFPFDPDELEAAGLDPENLKVVYLDPDTGEWTQVDTTVDTDANIAYASPEHFSSWTLIATTAPPPSRIVSGGGGGGGGGATGVTSVSTYVTQSGKFVVDVTAESADGKVEITVPKNTVGKNSVGQRLSYISIKEQKSPPAPPAGFQIIGLVYDIGPGGSTFEPAIYVQFQYPESSVPAGISEEDLAVATWQDGAWVRLAGSTVDTVNNTITAPINHFSSFTVMAPTAVARLGVTGLKVAPPVSYPGETVTITATVANTGDLSGDCEVVLTINDSVTATEKITLSGHATGEVDFTINPEKIGTYAITVNGMTAMLTVKEETTTVEEKSAGPPEMPEETPPVSEEASSAEAETTPSEEPAAPPAETALLPPLSQPETGGFPAYMIWAIIGIIALTIATGIIIRRRSNRKIS
jgi:uncharacterized membrane protein/phage protein U